MGITLEYSRHYPSSGTYWNANRQDKHSTEERISTCSNKENCKLVLPSTYVNMLWFHAYNQIQKYCAYPNYNTIPNILELRNLSLSVILGRPIRIVQTPIVLASNNTMTKLAKFESCNSKSDKQLKNILIDEYHLPLEECKRSNCLLLVHVALAIIPKRQTPNQNSPSEDLRYKWQSRMLTMFYDQRPSQ